MTRTQNGQIKAQLGGYDLTWLENSLSGLPKGALITEPESNGESITLSGTVGTHYAESSR